MTGEVEEIIGAVSRMQGWSWLLWVIVAFFVVKQVIDMAAETSEPVRKLLGWYGRRAANRQAARQAQLDTNSLHREVEGLKAWVSDNMSRHDLSEEASHLAWQLKRARWRAEMVDAYLINDEDWHRNVALMGIKGLPLHISFQEFERQWTNTHPRPARYDWETGFLSADEDQQTS